MGVVQSPFEKRLDCSIATLTFLEREIAVLRIKILDKAEEIAKRGSPPEKISVFDKEHVQAALEEMGLTQFLS